MTLGTDGTGGTDGAGGTVTELADEMIDVFFAQYPLAATVMGIRERDDRLTDYSPAAEAGTLAKLTDIAGRVEAVDPAGLSATDRVTRSVLLQQAATWRDIFDARM